MKISAPIFAAMLAAGGAAGALAATGDAYVYRISNGYNSEVRGTISYRVGKVDADRIEVAVTTDTPSAGVARTEVYTREGNWLRHPLASHDQLRDYEFASALPVYADGGSWSVRVNAVDPATGKRSSVRVDGKWLARSASPCPPARSTPSRSCAASTRATGTASCAKPRSSKRIGMRRRWAAR